MIGTERGKLECDRKKWVKWTAVIYVMKYIRIYKHAPWGKVIVGVSKWTIT